MRLVLAVFACFLIAATPIYSQIDPTFCTDQITPDDGQPVTLPYPVFKDQEQYQAVVEKNSGGITEETEEFYDGKNNVGVAITSVAGTTIATYYNYSINELLLVKDYQCKAYPLNESYGLGPFFYYVDQNGKEQIVSPFTLVIKNNIKTYYLGSTNRRVRGATVREWQSCIFSQKDQATLKIIFSFTEKWQPAIPIPDHPNIPVQVRVEYKYRDSKPNKVEVYAITSYTPYQINKRDEYVRTGVYCDGRVNIHDPPSVPRRFSLVAHRAEGKDGSDNMAGNLQIFAFSFDYNKQLYRSDFRENGQHITDIYDHNTNLNYKINKYAHNCSVAVIDKEIPVYHSPMDFFNLEAEPKPQYVGQKIVRGINCDVWVATRKFMGQDTVWDWYFMATGWTVQETNDVKFNEPVQIVVSTIPKQATEIRKQITYLISAFDQTRSDVHDYDISECEDIRRVHVGFNITNHPDYEIMKFHQGNFKDGLTYSIHRYTKIPLIRITRVNAYFHQKTAIVFLTLLEKSKLNGNPDGSVEAEISANDTFTMLQTGVQSGEFKVDFHYQKDKFTTVNVTAAIDKNSFTNEDAAHTRYVFNYYNEGKVDGYEGGALAGFIIGFLILGVILGFVAGIFLIIKRNSSSSSSSGGGFLNPNFKASASA